MYSISAETVFVGVVTLLSVLSASFGLYLKIRQVGDRIEETTRWRTTIDVKIENLIEKISELLEANKEMVKTTRELLEAKVKTDHTLAALDNSVKAAHRRLDEQRVEINKLREDVSAVRVQGK